MTKDLEETLAELGPRYQTLVHRLIAAYQPEDDRLPPTVNNSSSGRIVNWTAACLIAASLLVLLGLASIVRLNDSAIGQSPRLSQTKLVYTVAYAADAAALQTIVASQRSDGSWANDFITRQNAAALRCATDAAALVAYKRALRYLKSRGLEPLTEDELKARGDRAARLLAEEC